jgi:hypothetical protein
VAKDLKAFLATRRIYIKRFLSYDEAKIFVSTLNIKSGTEWNVYRVSGSRPENIPSNPASTYKGEGWVSWGDFLGTGTIAPQNMKFMSYEETRSFVQGLGLKSITEWGEYTRSGNKPDNIPTDPYGVYTRAGEWVSWGDFLGTGTIATQNMNFLPFEEARECVRKLGFKSKKEWKEYCKSGKKPNDVPATPYRVYKDKGWISWGDFLDKEEER